MLASSSAAPVWRIRALVNNGDTKYLYDLSIASPLLKAGLDYIIHNMSIRHSRCQLYDIEIYVPMIESIVNMQPLKDICVLYNENQIDGQCSGPCLLANYHTNIRDGLSYTVTIKAENILKFLRQLPKNVVVVDVVDTNNMKSNANLQTDDLESKYYDPIYDHPQLYQINPKPRQIYQKSHRRIHFHG